MFFVLTVFMFVYENIWFRVGKSVVSSETARKSYRKLIEIPQKSYRNLCSQAKLLEHRLFYTLLRGAGVRTGGQPDRAPSVATPSRLPVPVPPPRYSNPGIHMISQDFLGLYQDFHSFLGPRTSDLLGGPRRSQEVLRSPRRSQQVLGSLTFLIESYENPMKILIRSQEILGNHRNSRVRIAAINTL